MNYYEARHKKDGGGWHFTCMNDGEIWPVGYCRDHDPHETPREAEACWRQYLLDGQAEETYTNWQGCEAIVDGEKCDVPTKSALTTRRPHGHGIPLCDEHRTPEMLAALTPEPTEDGRWQTISSY